MELCSRYSVEHTAEKRCRLSYCGCHAVAKSFLSVIMLALCSSRSNKGVMSYFVDTGKNTLGQSLSFGPSLKYAALLTLLDKGTSF